jgi:hypothetical protein
MGCGSSKVQNAPGQFASLVVPSLPSFLEEFKAKRFLLLWRGSRDGFAAQAFHKHCDGHGNTLTFVADTKGNVFGGFTPVKWETRTSDNFKADDSGTSFLFTIKNPFSVPEKKFALKPDQKQFAIFCSPAYGPAFGNGFDLAVSDQSNTHTTSYAHMFGYTYANDTGKGGASPSSTFLAGSGHFSVKEVEVFEVLD